MPKHPLPGLAPPPAQNGPGFHHIICCCDMLPAAQALYSQAIQLARTSAARITLLHVLEPGPSTGAPADPLVWDLHRRAMTQQLSGLIDRNRWSGITDVAIVDGTASERICDFAEGEGADLIVMGTHGRNDRTHELGSTARHVAASFSGAVLLVPPETQVGKGPLRFMVPLDCSVRAEAAIPVASQLAKGLGAELILAHAQRDVELPGAGPFTPDLIELRDRLQQRNASAAEKYLRQLHLRLPRDRPAAQRKLLSGGDPRSLLLEAIRAERANLVVLTDTGMGGNLKLPLGSTADFLINNAPIPILIVRERARQPARPVQHAREAPARHQAF